MPESSQQNETKSVGRVGNADCLDPMSRETSSVSCAGFTNALLEQSSRHADPLRPHFDPRQLFEAVSKNYESWQQAMGKRIKLEESFLPFPSEDEIPGTKTSSGTAPILNYSLLEALDCVSNKHADELASLKGCNNESRDSIFHHALLKDSELEFLREKIGQIIKSNELRENPKGMEANLDLSNVGCPTTSGANKLIVNSETCRGFTLYDTIDEEGLYDGNSHASVDDDMDEYTDKSNDSICHCEDHDEHVELEFRYNYGPHHIQVEVNSIPECPTHAPDMCECRPYPIQNTVLDYDDDYNGPSCEFTFEYDHTGELVPIYNNVEEKLRQMTLKSRIGSVYNEKGQILQHSAKQGQDTSTKKKKKKKNKKNKKKSVNVDFQDEMGMGEDSAAGYHDPDNSPLSSPPHSEPGPVPKTQPVFGDPDCCLLCEYELIFGRPPRQLMKWYDQRMQWEIEKRQEIKRKLENTKLRALRKQRELRQKQLQQQRVLEQIEDSEHMLLIDDAHYEAPQSMQTPNSNVLEDDLTSREKVPKDSSGNLVK